MVENLSLLTLVVRISQPVRAGLCCTSKAGTYRNSFCRLCALDACDVWFHVSVVFTLYLYTVAISWPQELCIVLNFMCEGEAVGLPLTRFVFFV